MALIAIDQMQQGPKTVAVYSSMSLLLCRCKLLAPRCKTGRSTDAKLSNVFHCIVSLQFAILLRFSSFLHRVVTPTSCLGPLDLSLHSLGFPSSIARGRCLACALLCATQGRMSACWTRPAANPGGPQGGAQTGRSPGGGAGRKLSRPRFEIKCCGAFRHPARTIFGSLNGHGDSHTGEQNSAIDYKLHSAPQYNHKYKCTFNNAHN